MLATCDDMPLHRLQMASGHSLPSARASGRVLGAAGLSLFYASALAALLAISCCALFGRGLWVGGAVRGLPWVGIRKGAREVCSAGLLEGGCT